MEGGERGRSLTKSIAHVNGIKVGGKWLPHGCDSLSKAAMGN